MDDIFWEVRMTLYDSHVDSKSLGFYRTEEAALKAKAEEQEDAGENADSIYLETHRFED